MSESLKARKLNNDSIIEWQRNSYDLLRRRPLLIIFFTVFSLLIGIAFLSTCFTILMAFVIPLAFSFWVPVIMDKGIPLREVSYKEILYVIRNTIVAGVKLSLVFFVVVILPTTIVMYFFSEPSVTTDTVTTEDVRLMNTILFSFLIISISKTILEPKLTLSFYISLYSGMDFNESVVKVLNDSTINRELFTKFHICLFSYEIFIFITLAFLSTTMPLLSLGLIVISQSYITCMIYIIFKDIYMGGGMLDEVKEDPLEVPSDIEGENA